MGVVGVKNGWKRLVVGLALGLAPIASAQTPTEPSDLTAEWAEATPISTCRFIISSPGSYELVDDLSCNGTFAIQVIGTHDVQLRLNKHTIDAGGSSAIGVIDSTRVKVLGPGATRNGIGVFLTRTTDSLVRDLDIQDCVPGLLLFAGISLDASDENRIQGNRIDNCFAGIAMQESDGNMIIGNRATGNTDSGLQVAISDGNTIIHNVFDENDFGVALFAGSNGNHVASNTTDRNATSGIVVFFPVDSENLFTGNSSHDNAVFDMADFSGCANLWRGNAFDTDSEGDGPNAGCIR